MRDVQPGDVVLHLTDDSAFTGISRAAGSALRHPGPTGTEGRDQSGLLVPLKDYEPLDQPIPRDAWQREPYASELKAIRLRHSNLFYTSDLSLGQGQYLTECPPELASVLDAIYVKLAGKHLTNDVQVRAPEVLLTSQALQRLRDETLWNDDQLDELLTLLRASQVQLVLAGPPGTSKTWVLRKAINYLTNDNPRRSKFVQFHPSYSYEQFVEGMMPVPLANGLTFRLEPGIVKQMAKAMQGDDDDYYILIDEINRANLPSVFGELLMLFEYRDEAITLAHSGEFSLPDNLHFSGTMNTADRSIRSIDAAFRRRFEILECLPDGEILDRYYQGRNNKVQTLRIGFESLNVRLIRDLRGKHFQVGHTYFMRPEMDSGTLHAIWTRKVFPLLEEYFFDEPESLAGYTFEAFWPHV